MRKNRIRSMTIDTENQEEFNKEFERTHPCSEEKFLDEVGDEYLTNHKDSCRQYNKRRNRRGDYEGLWVFNEDELGAGFDENDKILGEENDIIKNNEEKGLELLC